MKPWVGYVRVSHVGSRGGDSFHSPGEQTEAIERWAASRRQPVVVLPPELDESGGRADRPILTEAIEGIETGVYRGLIVAYLSRASRSTKHLLELWDRIEAAGGQVIAVAENIDASTPAGRLTRTMLAAIAEHELDLHRERFDALRASATARGVWQRRQVPLGYVRDPKTRKLTPSQDADTVRRLFRDRANGVPLVRLADDVKMTPSGVRFLLRNRVYLGELKVGEYINLAAHPPLVDVDLFERVQATRVTRPAVRGGEPALLAGIVRCEACGRVMSRGNTAALVYSCAVYHSGARCPRPAAISLARLDEHVERVALEHLRLLQAAAVTDAAPVDDARAQVRAAETELQRFLLAVAATDIDQADYTAAMQARTDSVRVARERLDVLTRSVGVTVDGDPVRAWEQATVAQRNHLLRGLIESVVVRAAGRGRRVAVEDRVRVLLAGVS